VSTPGEGDGPRYDPYSQRGQQGGPGQQGAYGSPPPYGQPGQYAYNPYSSSPYPAGLDESEAQPVRRPGIMILSLILLVLSTLIFLLTGVVLLALPLDAATVSTVLARVDPSQQLGADQLVSVIRIVGGVLAVSAIIYILFAAFAFAGRNWARIVITVLTVGFVLLLAGGLANGAGADATSLTLVLAIMVAAIAGTVIMYLPEPRKYFAAPRR